MCFAALLAPTSTSSSAAAAAPNLLQTLIIPLAILGVVGLIAAILLQWAGLGRPGALAGLIAGALCGMTIAGRVAPEIHEKYFIGGIEERQAIEELASRQGADIKSLEASGVSQVAIDELAAQHEQERQEARLAYQKARWGLQAPMRLAGFTLAGLLMGWFVPRWRAMTTGGVGRSGVVDSSAESDERYDEGNADHTVNSPHESSWLEPIFIASWMILMVLAFLGAAVIFVFDGSRLDALAIGLSFAITMHGVRRVDLLPNLTDCGNVRALIARTIVFGWLAGIIALVWAGFNSPRAEDDPRVLDVSNIVALIAAGVISMAARLIIDRSHNGTDTIIVKAMTTTAHFLIVPLLTAMLAIHADLYDLTILGPLILGALIGGDGRWFGVASGLRVAGVRWRDAMHVALPVADAAAAQIALGYVFYVAGWIENLHLLSLVIAGAVVCDLTVFARGRLLARFQRELEEAERQAQRDEDESS